MKIQMQQLADCQENIMYLVLAVLIVENPLLYYEGFT